MFHEKYSLIMFIVLIAVTWTCSNAYAECAFQKGTVEQGVMAGYGDNFQHDIRGVSVDEDIEFYFLIPYLGKVFKEWNGCRSLGYFLEGFFSYADQNAGGRFAVGFTPFFQYNFKVTDSLVPFAGLGAGLLYTNLDPGGFGSKITFTPQIGTGIRYRTGTNTWLTFAYRLHHISNAGLDKENEAIDSNFLMVGIAVVR